MEEKRILLSFGLFPSGIDRKGEKGVEISYGRAKKEKAEEKSR
jgi:hypothetical protein